MPSFNTVKRLYNNGNTATIGQQLKQMSDDVMQETWNNDIQTRTCYIYDYLHDDNPYERTGYIPNTDGGKIKVSVKFILKEYKSASKDDPEYHIQFEPDVWNSQSCIPDWFTRYQNFDVHFPIGLYIDIPDSRGVYWKWLIFYEEVSNQFPKFGVLRCNYNFRWIYNNNGQRYKRSMWGVERTQSSYTSGKWTGDKFTVFDEQGKFMLPWNTISSELLHDQRLIVSMLQEKPLVYIITKVKNTSPKGIVNITVKQDEFNDHADYVDFNTGEMYADYYQYDKEPILEQEQPKENTDRIELYCSLSQIKVGGGYKIITATCLDESNNDITGNYTGFSWTYKIDDTIVDDIIQTETDIENKVKIKLGSSIDESFIGKTLVINCTALNSESIELSNSLDVNIIAL